MNTYYYIGDGTEAGVQSLIVAKSKEEAKKFLLAHEFFKQTDVRECLPSSTTIKSWEEYFDLHEDCITLKQEGIITEGVVFFEDRPWD